MQKQREHWSSHLGFFLAAVGSAIGLGTLWKFPYVVGQNGGGLFVLAYILCTLFVGLPVFIGELLIGRKAQRGAVGAFATLAGTHSSWKITGWLGVAASFLIMSYYSVIAGWGLNYVLMSLSQSFQNKTPEEMTEVFFLLSRSGDITLFWHLLFTFITAAVVYPGIRRGIEFWSRIMTTSLFTLLVALLLYTMTLEGFSEAVTFIFYPDASRFNMSSILEALGLAFFTLSLGQGIMITYGSYMESSEDIPKTGLFIAGTIIAVSLTTALTIFSIIFTFDFNPQAGPGLVFQTLPILFSKLPGALLISTAFFLLFVFTALTSSIALVEVIVANGIDLFGWSRKRAVIIVAVSCFLFGIPSALSHTDLLFANWPAIFGQTFFETIDSLVSIWLIPIGGLLVALFTGWVVQGEISKEEFYKGTVLSYLYTPWRFFIRWVAPLAILLIIIQRVGLL